MKRYGSGKTHLSRLTEEAERVYNVTEPLEIWELVFEELNGDRTYYYTTTGAIKTDRLLTEGELNQMLINFGKE